jgi:methylenetetrahydrofolate dehydrogenase (NADP+) / methenyltetrahydrofolate cyclohydrolase
MPRSAEGESPFRPAVPPPMYEKRMELETSSMNSAPNSIQPATEGLQLVAGAGAGPTIIDGKALAAKITGALAEDVRQLINKTGVTPGLAVVLVGEDPASQIYVRKKVALTEKVGMKSFEHRLAADTAEADLLALVERLNTDPAVHGILVQLPLPQQINAKKVLDAINPAKDVDGFHPVNVGRLSNGTGGLVPCTPLGCMKLLDTVIDDYRGLKAVVIGKSNIVGKPVALLLLERECTVTVTHILTRNLPEIVRSADIIVVAAGSPRLVRGDWVKPGAVVIDVGITRVVDDQGNRSVVGDAAFDEMAHVGAITPVPGGVGPMTIACLLTNTFQAASQALAAEPVESPASIVEAEDEALIVIPQVDSAPL